MRVRLNLATSPLENNRRFLLGWSVLGVVAFIALAVLGFRAYRDWSADRALRRDVARLQSEMNQLTDRRRELVEFFNRPDNLRLRDRAAFLNTLIEQRSFPWTKIFMDLEEILPEGVRVISISPKMAAGRVEVKLTVGASNDDAKLKFLRALEASKAFSRIQLLAETRPVRQGEADQVQLELLAWYVTT